MRSIKLPLMGRQRPQSSCQMLGLRLLRVVRPRAAANLTEAAVSVESIGRVIKAKRVFILSLLLSGGLCPLDKSSAAAARQRVHRTRLPLDRCPRSRAATANTVFFMARIDRVGEVYSKPAKKPMPAGTPGDGLSQSTAIIRGYAPDTPSRELSRRRHRHSRGRHGGKF